MKKCAVITGIFGQDGSLLAEHLISKQYRVIGLVRELKEGFAKADNMEVLEVDISNPQEMGRIISLYKPDEVYHLAAVHHSSENKSDAAIRDQMLKVNFTATQSIMEAILRHSPKSRFLFAGSSQMYSPGNIVLSVDEGTPYRPSTYYGVIKVASAQLLDLWRRERGLWGVTAILFNHESPRRRNNFLSRKVTSYAAACHTSKANTPAGKLHINDTAAQVDWSAASDFVRAYHLCLQVDSPTDYVLASGELHSVGDLIEVAFGGVSGDWRDHVSIGTNSGSNPKAPLVGNPDKAIHILKWKREKTFQELIDEMVAHDTELQS